LLTPSKVSVVVASTLFLMVGNRNNLNSSSRNRRMKRCSYYRCLPIMLKRRSKSSCSKKSSNQTVKSTANHRQVLKQTITFLMQQ
jgi:hypothetical protein